MPGPTYLPVQSAARFEKPLVAERAIEKHFAVRADFGRSDHRSEHIAKLIVEIARDEPGQRAIERETADQKQHDDPGRRDQHHAPRQRASMPQNGSGNARLRGASLDGCRRSGTDHAGRRRAYARCSLRNRGSLSRGQDQRDRQGCSQVRGWW